jgi:choline kinase
MMRGIILAACSGTRFNGAVQPKCLATFDERTLMNIQLSVLRACGINDIDTPEDYRHGLEPVYPVIRAAIARTSRMAVGA